MGRNPRCSDDGFSRGAWTASEDKILLDYIKARGEGRWSRVSRETALKRCGKSCRLRWMNYLRPDIKRGNISPDEDELIIRLHKLLGNRWSLIAGRLPGRTDNEIKNYWNTNLAKKASEVQLRQFRTTSLKPQNVPNESDHPIPIPVPQQATPTLFCTNMSNPGTDQTHYNMVPTHTIAYDSDSSGGSPLTSVEDLMMNFNVQSDDICQILESDFPGINQVYLEGLLSPEPELEIEDFLNMVEEQGFRNRFSACLVSADAIVNNNSVDGANCIINSDMGFVSESDHQEKWPGFRVGDNDINVAKD